MAAARLADAGLANAELANAVPADAVPADAADAVDGIVSAATEMTPAIDRLPAAAREMSLVRFPRMNDGMERWRAKLNPWYTRDSASASTPEGHYPYVFNPYVAAGNSSAMRRWRGSRRRLLLPLEAGLPEAAAIAQAGCCWMLTMPWNATPRGLIPEKNERALFQDGGQSGNPVLIRGSDLRCHQFVTCDTQAPDVTLDGIM